MMPAAEVIPLSPNGAKFDRLSVFQPLSPRTTNSSRTPILMHTITAFVFADSLAPRISSSVQSITRITAGRLNTPPCSGAWDRLSGSVNPKRLSNNSFKYCDQPTATAAADTPYFSSSQAATPIAGSSPSVAYAYEEDETETGNALVSSAYQIEVRPSTAPAITNDQITAGPATGTACARTKKIPVPMVAPIPNMDSWNRPIVRTSSLWPVSVPLSCDISGTGLRRNSCRTVIAM